MKERKIVMLTHPTLDQMQVLGLAGMAAAYRQLAEQDHATDLSRQGCGTFVGSIGDNNATHATGLQASSRALADLTCAKEHNAPTIE